MVYIFDCMIPWENVVSCKKDEKICEVAPKFIDNKLSSLVVVDRKMKVEGIVTKTDIIEAFISATPKDAPISNIMTHFLAFAHPKDSREKVGQIMVDNQIHHVVIVDHLKKPLGLVTSLDIVRNYVQDSSGETGLRADGNASCGIHFREDKKCTIL